MGAFSLFNMVLYIIWSIMLSFKRSSLIDDAHMVGGNIHYKKICFNANVLFLYLNIDDWRQYREQRISRVIKFPIVSFTRTSNVVIFASSRLWYIKAHPTYELSSFTRPFFTIDIFLLILSVNTLCSHTQNNRLSYFSAPANPKKYTGVVSAPYEHQMHYDSNEYDNDQSNAI